MLLVSNTGQTITLHSGRSKLKISFIYKLYLNNEKDSNILLIDKDKYLKTQYYLPYGQRFLNHFACLNLKKPENVDGNQKLDLRHFNTMSALSFFSRIFLDIYKQKIQ